MSSELTLIFTTPPPRTHTVNKCYQQIIRIFHKFIQSSITNLIFIVFISSFHIESLIRGMGILVTDFLGRCQSVWLKLKKSDSVDTLQIYARNK